MTRKPHISRLGLAGGLAVVATAGVLVTSAAGGTSPTRPHAPATGLPTLARTTHHNARHADAVHRWNQHRPRAAAVTRRSTDHRGWRDRCDPCRAGHRSGQPTHGGSRDHGSARHAGHPTRHRHGDDGWGGSGRDTSGFHGRLGDCR
jgi:hypothetical protein